MHKTHADGTLDGRDVSYLETDIATVRWIAQAAVDVELFTIPLYMTSLYSIVGMHPITGENNAFYKGRTWPGPAPTGNPLPPGDAAGWANPRAFNIIFSVFVQEMLHLQMAANIATAIGAQPRFTDTVLQNAQHGWTCYGDTLTTIPGIVDLTDTEHQSAVKVALGPLDADRIALFLAIEQPQPEAEADIVRHCERYFPQVPFTVPTGEFLFGSIGYMYQCFRDYLRIVYSDGTMLWDHVFDPASQQNDMFNVQGSGHAEAEYPGFAAVVSGTDSAAALGQVLTMMNAITDQGEGATLKARLLQTADAAPLEAVEAVYRSDYDALFADYPSYTDTGAPDGSADADARFENDGDDHYERFQEVAALLTQGGILTWGEAGKSGRWTAGDLTTPDFAPGNDLLPAPEQIAGALNALYDGDAANGDDANFALMSQAVVGAIKGVTTVLDLYWSKTNPPTGFPYPSMAGSGDRMAAAWAVFGRTPDLATGIADPDTSKVGHACQGLDLGAAGANACAGIEVFHTCKGSNVCKGMAGCGFVHSAGSSGGGGCSAVRTRALGGVCGGPTPPADLYTAPSDNICAGFGGCAIPISACQIYPTTGTMAVMDLVDGQGSKQIGTLGFSKGDRVEDIAFAAFAQVAAARGVPVAPRQPPSDIRLAFPPST